MPTERTPEEIAKGLRPEQREALLYIIAHPGPQNKEAFMLDLNVCVAMRRVGRLMTGGWYEREREYRFYPTDLGRAVAEILTNCNFCQFP